MKQPKNSALQEDQGELSQVSPLSISSGAPSEAKHKHRTGSEPIFPPKGWPCNTLLDNSEFKTEENFHIKLKWAFIFFTTCPSSDQHSLPSEGRKDKGHMDSKCLPCCRFFTRHGDRAGDRARVWKLGLQGLSSWPGENHSTQ